MKTPRETFKALIDAAHDVEEAVKHANHEDVLLAAATLKIAAQEANEELERRHQFVVFMNNGKVTSALTDVDTGMSCMVVKWGEIPKGRDDWDYVVDEVKWSETNTTSEKLLTNHIPCDVDPVIVSDVVRMFDAQRSKILKEFQWDHELLKRIVAGHNDT